MRYLFVALLAGFSISPAYGQKAVSRWVVLYSMNGQTLSADTASIRLEGRNVRIWTRMDYDVPREGDGQTYSRAVNSWEVDCAAMRIRQRSGAIYDSSGRLLDSDADDPDSQWENPIPESNGEVITREVCAAFADG